MQREYVLKRECLRFNEAEEQRIVTELAIARRLKAKNIQVSFRVEFKFDFQTFTNQIRVIFDMEV